MDTAAKGPLMEGEPRAEIDMQEMRRILRVGMMYALAISLLFFFLIWYFAKGAENQPLFTIKSAGTVAMILLVSSTHLGLLISFMFHEPE